MSTMTPLLFLAGSPGPLELLVIFAVVLVLFGPRKLPEIARSIGRMLHELRKASDDFRSQVMSIEDTRQSPDNRAQEPTDDTLMEGERPREPIGGGEDSSKDADHGSPS